MAATDGCLLGDWSTDKMNLIDKTEMTGAGSQECNALKYPLARFCSEPEVDGDEEAIVARVIRCDQPHHIVAVATTTGRPITTTHAVNISTFTLPPHNHHQLSTLEKQS